SDVCSSDLLLDAQDETTVGAGELHRLREDAVVEIEAMHGEVDAQDAVEDIAIVAQARGPIPRVDGSERPLARLGDGGAAGGLLAQTLEILAEGPSRSLVLIPRREVRRQVLDDALEDRLGLAVVVRGLDELAPAVMDFRERVVEIEEDLHVAQILSRFERLREVLLDLVGVPALEEA